jgi:hypothetical protein
MAAVAESAATTRWREDPRSAKAAIGSSSVYRPATTGIPAIFAYPMACGTASAASVTPARRSAGTQDHRTGRTPCRTGQVLRGAGTV